MPGIDPKTTFVVIGAEGIEHFFAKLDERMTRQRAERAPYEAELLAQVKKQTAALEQLAALAKDLVYR